MDPSTATASWIQTGGVLAFAAAVLWELKQLRPLIKEWIDQREKDRGLLNEVKTILSVLLERERMRAAQRDLLLRQAGVTTPPSSTPPPLPADQNWDLDNTGAVEVPLQKRPKTNPQGYPAASEYSYTRKKDER
jgi:hypothetical protein